jgi:hypothetical protein
MFGKKEAFWVPDLHRTLSRLCSSCSRPSPISGECRTPFREPLQFIVIAVMSVMSGTFPDTNGVFYKTMNCKRILDARLVCHPRGLSSIIY